MVVTGGVDKVFCAGANIQMLASSTHGHKVNFCKFTNETRNGIEDASANSGQVWIAAVNGTAAGGGYELALACDEILLIDDRASAVSLPEVPLLAVLPGTGGLTRVVDKRFVRRDLADVFATRTEGVKGQQAVDWGLVDAIAPKSGFDELVRIAGEARAAESDRPDDAAGVDLPILGALPRSATTNCGRTFVDVAIDRDLGCARLVVRSPQHAQPATGDELVPRGRRGVAAACRARARSRDPASPLQRARDRHVGADDRRRAPTRSPRPRTCARRSRPLARPRGPPVLDAHAEAPRRRRRARSSR